MHGLLQTPEYATAVIAADDRLSDDVVQRRVRFRLERQQTILSSDPKPSVTIVLGEAALSLVVGSLEIMAAQIEHLHDGDRHPNINVRVLPFGAGAYPRRGSFALLDFDDDEDPSVAYAEGPGGARYYDRPDERAEYEHVWNILFDRSTPIEEWTR